MVLISRNYPRRVFPLSQTTLSTFAQHVCKVNSRQNPGLILWWSQICFQTLTFFNFLDFLQRGCTREHQCPSQLLRTFSGTCKMSQKCLSKPMWEYSRFFPRQFKAGKCEWHVKMWRTQHWKKHHYTSCPTSFMSYLLHVLPPSFHTSFMSYLLHVLPLAWTFSCCCERASPRQSPAPFITCEKQTCVWKVDILSHLLRCMMQVHPPPHRDHKLPHAGWFQGTRCSLTSHLPSLIKAFSCSCRCNWVGCDKIGSAASGSRWQPPLNVRLRTMHCIGGAGGFSQRLVFLYFISSSQWSINRTLHLWCDTVSAIKMSCAWTCMSRPICACRC